MGSNPSSAAAPGGLNASAASVPSTAATAPVTGMVGQPQTQQPSWQQMAGGMGAGANGQNPMAQTQQSGNDENLWKSHPFKAIGLSLLAGAAPEAFAAYQKQQMEQNSPLAKAQADFYKNSRYGQNGGIEANPITSTAGNAPKIDPKTAAMLREKYGVKI